MPVYAAVDLKKIPTVPIEDIKVFTMAQKLERLELRLAKVEVFNQSSEGMSNKGNVVQGNRDDGGIAMGNAGSIGREDTIMSVDLCQDGGAAGGSLEEAWSLTIGQQWQRK